jgi:hypothetical protein
MNTVVILNIAQDAEGPQTANANATATASGAGDDGGDGDRSDTDDSDTGYIYRCVLLIAMVPAAVLQPSSYNLAATT